MSKRKYFFFSGLTVLAVLIVSIAISLPWRPLLIKNNIIFVEVAKTHAAHQKGLQGRLHLAENQGMLFIFEKEGYPQFWMKETFIPLSIAFIDGEKRIVDIQKMIPLRTDVLYVPSGKSKYALEMNAGWFEKKGISAEDRLLFW